MTSIGQLFIAGIFPGILSVLIYMTMVFFRCWKNPSLAPQAERFSWIERMRSLSKGWRVIAIFVIVIGGLYGGIVTPMEVGALGSFIGLVLWLIAKHRGRAECDPSTGNSKGNVEYSWKVEEAES
ncbi:TRAP transporter large permease subunit [Chloroflexota bacterium]